jgi:hypothetical protein
LQRFSCPANPISDAEAEWPETDAQWLGLYEGEFAAPAVADLDADGHFDLMVGVRDGGLTLWNGHATAPALKGCTPDVIDGINNIVEEAPVWHPHPNPLKWGSAFEIPGEAIQVMDLAGRRLGRLEAQGGRVTWPQRWSAGTYLIIPESRQGGNKTGASSYGKGARRLIVIDP